jgi:hypothetical protein
MRVHRFQRNESHDSFQTINSESKKFYRLEIQGDGLSIKPVSAMKRQ